MLNRKQFRQHWNKVKPGLGDDNSSLWAYEEFANKKCRWFVKISPKSTRTDFWRWCTKHCQGSIMCYSNSEVEEWWGFTHKADIALWLLKWS